MKTIARFIKIQRIFIRYHFDDLIIAHPLFAPFKWLRKLMPWRWFKKKHTPTPEEICQALIELGPIFVKFGQLLSTRQDLLSAPLANALAKLQDNVPAFDGKLAKTMIEKRLGKPIEEVFNDFDETPLASASVAQVHTATLKSGEQIVIKVLRPDIHKKIKQDIALLKSLAKAIESALPSLRRFKPIEVVQEFEHTLTHELDLQREAANASQLKRNFATSNILYVPKIYWPYCYHDVMVMERIYGLQISDIEGLKKANVNLEKLARYGVEIFFTQVFRDCFFHADMHPGNIYVDIKDPQNPRYIALDFGIMGSLNPSDQKYLATNFLAFFRRNYREVARLHIDSGWVPANTRLEDFESSIRAVSEPIFEKPLGEISFGKSLLQLLQTAREFDMQVQPQLVLLQKTLLSVEGLGQQLYPQLNLWETAKPFLEQWTKEHMGLKAFSKNLKASLPMWLNQMPNLPEAILDIVHHHQQQIHEHKQTNQNSIFKHLNRFSWLGVVMIATGSIMLVPNLYETLKPHVIVGIGLIISGGVLYRLLRFKKTTAMTSRF
jgi:ubiquinone biosynthesis protein